MAKKVNTTPKADEGDKILSSQQWLDQLNAGAKPVEEPEKKPEVDVNALSARLEALEKRNTALEQTNLSLMAQPAPVQVQTPAPAPQPEPVDLSNLPDPVTDPEAYAKALQDRLSKSVESQVTAQLAATAPEPDDGMDEKLAGLWEDFSEAHPDYAKETDRMEFVVDKITKKASRRGVDVNRYMFGAGDQFFDDIVKTYDETFGAIKADGKSEEPAPKGGEEEDENRTGGIFGGVETGGRPTGGADEKPGDMIEDLHALQKKSGFW